MAVLFDLDGTLLDTAPDLLKTTNMLLQQHGKEKINKDELLPLISIGSTQIIETIFKIEQSDPSFNNIKEDFLKTYEAIKHALTVPFPGINLLLQQLEQSKILWGIVTNKSEYFARQLISSDILSCKPHCIVGGDTTSHSKPHPEPLLYASKLLNVAANDCIYIGDAKSDMIAGNAAGMYTICALYGYIDVDHEIALEWPADHSIMQVEEIFPLIKKWHQSKRCNSRA